MRKELTTLLCAALLVAGCGKTDRKANALLEEARTALAEQRYGDVQATIDTLRNRYPEAIEARKEALHLWQQAELLRTQKELAATDSLLQVVGKAYDEARQRQQQADERDDVEAWKQHNRTANQLKARLDSLQNRFDVACAKIKYIHKRQKEL